MTTVRIVGLATIFLSWNDLARAEVPGAFISAEEALEQRLGATWRSEPAQHIQRELVAMAEELPVGGAIDLPTSVPCGLLDFRGVADDVQVTGGFGGVIVFGAGQRGLELMFSRCEQWIAAGRDRPEAKRRPNRSNESFQLVSFRASPEQVFGPRTEPASELFALFNRGAIHIKADVKNCAWICGDNTFGKRTVTAEARVDDSLFLWLGINWPFQDYNAHWNPKNSHRDWVTENAQLWFDLKGGGRGTRLYELIETNYGNPGPGAVFLNCKELAVYHGSTERGSSQGPGVYWLKNCERMQLGLRGINAFGSNVGDPRNADANRDITIEGGRGNILHAMRTWSNANEISLWNSDPELQQWMVASQYGQKGVENTLRFAVSPYTGRPTQEFLKTFDARAAGEAIFKRRELKLKTNATTKDWPNPETVEKLSEKLKKGRHFDAPLNALDEETFLFGKSDLTRGDKPLTKLPAPPSVPATAAPKTRRVIAFTQQPEFGKELLSLGADPTGKEAADDAFAHLMYGMNRADLQKLLDRAAAADAAIWKLHNSWHDRAKWDAARGTEAYKTARATIDDVMKTIRGAQANRKKMYADRVKALGDAINLAKKNNDSDQRAKLEAELKALEASANGGTLRVEVPVGTFLLRQPLYLLGGISGFWGAGPEKSTLTTDQKIHVIDMRAPCTVANFTIKGGTVGLAITGHDHGYELGSPTLKSYVAGQDFYALTFRDQSFAGIHVGNDDVEVMGGAEHDQNKYVDLRFLNTGDYGIYMNTGMLDKWLCLHGEFIGQRKAGISIKFNNLIHGCVVGCSFTNINGPGIDFLGGNAEIGYRPWQTWIEECDFLECGNANCPAVEQGIAELAAFTHCKVVTKTKAIAGGYAGSPQICQDNIIDVKLIQGNPAVRLRAVRLISVSRTNGHIIKNVTASGPVVFVNDSNADNTYFAKTRERYGKAREPLKWDTNPMAAELAPKNGWIHPFLFYRCDFGGEKYAYTLLNVDVDAGKVKQRIELSKFE